MSAVGRFVKGIKMKFSVIVPVYNAEQYIEQSIQSVLKQTNREFEIVLVNDGSTDSSGNICNQYAEKHSDKIKVIHQQNQGPLMTRLCGIANARGEYCVFLDSDDTLVPEALVTIEKSIEKYNEPDMVIYSFYYDRLDGKKEKAVSLFEDEVVFEGQESKKELYKKFFTGTGLNNVWTKAVKRTVFEGKYPDYREYDKLRCSEDRLHAMGMVFNANKIVYIDVPLIEYKLIPNSISRTFTIDSVSRFNVKEIYKEEQKYLTKWGLTTPEWKHRLDASYMLQTWYILDLYYNKIKDEKIRNELLAYNWFEFIPSGAIDEYENNSYLNAQQKQCWKWIIEKNYSALKKYFRKKKIRTVLKECKQVLFKKGK